jgi:hypothetical protein
MALIKVKQCSLYYYLIIIVSFTGAVYLTTGFHLDELRN